MSLLIILVLLFFTIMGFGGPGQSEPSVAVAPPPVPVLGECDVKPRMAEEIANLKATPVATEVAGTPESTQPVDEETRAAIERVVQMADACAESGDYDRLAALYSAHAIQTGVFDAETVPINRAPRQQPPKSLLPASSDHRPCVPPGG